MSLDGLENEEPQRSFWLSSQGETFVLRPAPEVPWAGLLHAGGSWHGFVEAVVPDDVQHIIRHLPGWKMQAVVAAYRCHYGLCQTPAEDQRLASLIQAYGKAIEADLRARYPGVDLCDEWRSRRWRRLLNLIDHLPRHSFLHEAMSEDEALAEAMLSHPEPTEKPPARRWSEFTPDVELLSGAVDRIAEVVNAIAAANGAKPRKVKPMPRPVTAFEKVRERQAKQKHRSVVARVLPQGADTAAFLRGQEEKSRRRRRARGVRDRAEPGRQLFPET
jgi:hypothetical protein